MEFAIQLPGIDRLLVVEGPKCDVRENDLLTLYTELLVGQRKQ